MNTEGQVYGPVLLLHWRNSNAVIGAVQEFS
jgi:hypothetical protein